MPNMKMSWMSTGFGTADGPMRPLKLLDLEALAAGSEHIAIVSAFYDTEFFGRIVGAIPQSRRAKVQLEVFLNAGAGKRRAEDAQVLRKLESSWRKGNASLKHAQIRVVSRRGIFHTKLLVFRKRGAAVVWVGSANATHAAYSYNEELMLRLSGATVPTAVAKYLERLEAESRPLGIESESVVRSLAGLMREGTLYYKPNTIVQFRFDLRLPEETRRELNRSRVRITGINVRAPGMTYDPVVGLSTLENSDDRGVTAQAC